MINFANDNENNIINWRKHDDEIVVVVLAMAIMMTMATMIKCNDEDVYNNIGSGSLLCKLRIYSFKHDNA